MFSIYGLEGWDHTDEEGSEATLYVSLEAFLDARELAALDEDPAPLVGHLFDIYGADLDLDGMDTWDRVPLTVYVTGGERDLYLAALPLVRALLTDEFDRGVTEIIARQLDKGTARV